MAEKREYRLKIEAYSPRTMPMKRLAEYLADVSVLFGEEDRVHLIAIEESSTCPVVLVDREAEPSVIERIHKAQNREGPIEPIRAISSINARLIADNTSAALLNPVRDNILPFPGAKTPKRIEWPSINQAGELYGIPIVIGGKNDPVPVHLLDGEKELPCLAPRAKAKEIAEYLFSATLRAFGRGRWRKSEDGSWEMERFLIESFEVTQRTSLNETVNSLRAIEAKWKSIDDPIATLDAIRTGDMIERNGPVRQ
jgi:hypothetical protein